MKRLLILFCIISSVHLNAQTGIGTTTPDPSAKLEVASNNKGFLPPRIQLTATNSASPISNPANGLLVFNTVTAGSNPFQVVPGYYYWDATGQQWVSLSTTVGNVQNQAIFRSTSSINALNAISSWESRFNNISNGDLAISSSTNFALSNGFYKIEWALPYQTSSTYNDMLLQENISGTWSTFRNNNAYARIANGGGSDWGGTTFAADVVDCTSSTRTFRLYNADGTGRTLFAGATFIITKLNPSITTSTTADNLGNHTATNNVQLNGNYLSNDGGNEGIRVDNSGNVGIGINSPTQALDVSGNVKATNFIGSGSQLTDIANRTTGSWNVTTGNNNYSFTVSAGSYVMWVYANIPNGIIAWNATLSVTNSNVPVVGSQYAWVYNGGGTPIDFTSIPNQITGTNNTIIRSTISGSTSNTFTFGINNTSGAAQTVYYGYIRL
ncbi:MAG: hypothetical protein ACO239_05960 [Sediminibacterium sp.]